MGEERGLPGSGIAVVGWGLLEAEEPATTQGVGQGLCESPGHGYGTRRGFRVGFRPYLKSLSLDVIFSSRLEMWYEALAMLTASIPPAGAADAAARCRRRCCSSH